MSNPPYTLGLDVGIASVGAALLTEDDILGMHVRTFSAAERPTQQGVESLNAERREARSSRRRLRRRKHRLERARRLFARIGLLPSHTALFELAPGLSPWQLRSEGLERRLSPEEWATVMYHLLKHRGFQSNRKSEIKTDDKLGDMLTALNENHQLMHEKGYKTIGDMAWRDEAFKTAKRNKRHQYSHSFQRRDIADELACLFEAQRALGNPFTSNDFLEQMMALLMARRPTVKGDDIEKMVGRCTLEPEELRAAKASFSAERFLWLSKLNNLKLVFPGERRPLSNEEKNALIELPFEQKKVTFATIRRHLSLPKADAAGSPRFNLALNPNNEPIQTIEKKALFEAKGFHAIRSAYEDAGLTAEWARDKYDRSRLDSIATTISLYRDDSIIRPALQDAGVEDNVIDAVLSCSFEKFVNLSLKAINQLLPHMERGLRYDEAADAAGYAHATPRKIANATGVIPMPDRDDIRNPVVFRSLNQARKLVNAIVKQYGLPAAVHIEMGKELSKPASERQTIEKEQKKYQDQKKKLADEFEELFNQPPRRDDLLKLRLYKEQDGQCAYTQTGLDLYRLCEPGYAEVDHILPLSRSLDDSMLNKALVRTKENQNKGNLTPFEYMGSDEDSYRWRMFAEWVLGNPKIRQGKRNRYLRKDFSEQVASEFRDRHLNDTRYVGRELKAMIEQHLHWHPLAKEKNRCVVVSGQLTAFLRHRWGFKKNRIEGDLHHAVDAAVVAACSRSMVQRMAGHSKRKELALIKGGYTDPQTGEIIDIDKLRVLESTFPLPWPDFREAVLKTLHPAPPGTPSAHQGVRVSRMPTRRNLGAAHKDTIRSLGKDRSLFQDGLAILNTPLTKLTLANLEKVVGYDDPRNAGLINAIRERLQAFGGKGATAFGAEQPPLHKPSKKGKGPLVRSVKMYVTQKSGLEVHKGIALNGTIVRTDVFSKNGKFFVVPLYVSDIVRSKLKNKAVVAGKPRQEWPEMDDSYQFLFSLNAGDWVSVENKKGTIEGYFMGVNSSNGLFLIKEHDGRQMHEMATKSAASLNKKHVDMLGNLYTPAPEKRKPLRKGQVI